MRENWTREACLEKRILRARATLGRANQLNNHGENPCIVQDTAQITNFPRNEGGITSIVISSGTHMVTLRNNKSSILYTHAHLNVEYALTEDNNDA